jgi:hypothetical protein
MHSIKLFHHNLHSNSLSGTKNQPNELKQNTAIEVDYAKLALVVFNKDILKLREILTFNGHPKPKDIKLNELIYSIKHSNNEGVGDPLIYLLRVNLIPCDADTRKTIQTALDKTSQDKTVAIKTFKEALQIIDNNMKK